MWIKMLTDQVGPDGIFLKGQIIPLPEKMLKKLDPDSYVEVEMDEHRMQQMDVEDRLRSLNAELTTLSTAVEATKKRLKELYQRRKVIHARIRDAENEIKQTAEAGAEAKAGTEAKAESDAITEAQTSPTE